MVIEASLLNLKILLRNMPPFRRRPFLPQNKAELIECVNMQVARQALKCVNVFRVSLLLTSRQRVSPGLTVPIPIVLLFVNWG